GKQMYRRWRIDHAVHIGKGTSQEDEKFVQLQGGRVDTLQNQTRIGKHRLTFGAVANSVERGSESIIHQESADQRFADAGDELDPVDGLERADDADERANDASLRAGRHQPGWRWLREQVAVARVRTPIRSGLERLEDGDRAIEAADRACYQRPPALR